MDQTRAGDITAFEHLIRHMQPVVHRWALAYTKNGDEADDVMQEVFVAVLRDIRQYNGRGVFHHWLYRIVSRVATRQQRKRRRRELLAATPRALPDREVYETDPGGRVDRERLQEIVRQFWLELPQQQRSVLDLVDFQGYSPAEAAEMMDLVPATLRANLFKARRTLRGRIIARYPGLAQEAGWK